MAACGKCVRGISILFHIAFGAVHILLMATLFASLSRNNPVLTVSKVNGVPVGGNSTQMAECAHCMDTSSTYMDTVSLVTQIVIFVCGFAIGLRDLVLFLTKHDKRVVDYPVVVVLFVGMGTIAWSVIKWMAGFSCTEPGTSTVCTIAPEISIGTLRANESAIKNFAITAVALSMLMLLALKQIFAGLFKNTHHYVLYHILAPVDEEAEAKQRRERNVEDNGYYAVQEA